MHTPNVLSHAASGRASKFSEALGQNNGSSKGASNLKGYTNWTNFHLTHKCTEAIRLFS